MYGMLDRESGLKWGVMARKSNGDQMLYDVVKDKAETTNLKMNARANWLKAEFYEWERSLDEEFVPPTDLDAPNTFTMPFEWAPAKTNILPSLDMEMEIGSKSAPSTAISHVAVGNSIAAFPIPIVHIEINATPASVSPPAQSVVDASSAPAALPVHIAIDATPISAAPSVHSEVDVTPHPSAPTIPVQEPRTTAPSITASRAPCTYSTRPAKNVRGAKSAKLNAFAANTVEACSTLCDSDGLCGGFSFYKKTNRKKTPCITYSAHSGLSTDAQGKTRRKWLTYTKLSCPVEALIEKSGPLAIASGAPQALRCYTKLEQSTGRSWQQIGASIDTGSSEMCAKHCSASSEVENTHSCHFFSFSAKKMNCKLYIAAYRKGTGDLKTKKDKRNRFETYFFDKRTCPPHLKD
jgi:hypothetical protein